jgi:hypothetical protein
MRWAVAGIATWFLVVSLVADAGAIPPFQRAFAKRYGGSRNYDAQIQRANCMLCHTSNTDKRLKNSYGDAVAIYLVKADYDERKGDPDKADRYIDVGLKRAEEELSPYGLTFGELIKQGKLPGG